MRQKTLKRPLRRLAVLCFEQVRRGKSLVFIQPRESAKVE